VKSAKLMCPSLLAHVGQQLLTKVVEVCHLVLVFWITECYRVCWDLESMSHGSVIIHPGVWRVFRVHADLVQSHLLFLLDLWGLGVWKSHFEDLVVCVCHDGRIYICVYAYSMLMMGFIVLVVLYTVCL